MLADSRKQVRELGLQTVFKCRIVVKLDNSIRKLKIPMINFNADNYMELIDWNSSTIIEPPLMTSVSDNELNQIILDVPEEMHILRCLSHSQAVERCVKLVTEALATACVNDA